MGALNDAAELNSDFAAFYERHVGLVAAYLGRRLGRPDLVFDLVAETFARALAHRDQYWNRRRVCGNVSKLPAKFDGQSPPAISACRRRQSRSGEICGFTRAIGSSGILTDTIASSTA